MSDGTYAAHCHTPQFFAHVAQMVSEYLDSRPDPAIYDFLMDDFDALAARHGGVGGASFKRFPSYPQRFIERLAVQPPYDADPGSAAIEIEPLPPGSPRTAYTGADLHVRRFHRGASRRIAPAPRRSRAA
jgi:hypothetical protein